MVQSRTLNLLPELFRTETNKKFLNATMDQLVAEPKLKKIYGYVGRTFSPLYKKTDNYIPEIDALRKNYQLEPSVILNDSKGNPDVYVSYINLLNQIQVNGGLTNNQDRLFDSEFYTFDGLIDYDKITNFTNYYWLENGPDTVSVFSTLVDPEQTFDLTRDTRSGSYQFSGFKVTRNPQIYLSRGGTYKFKVNQNPHSFWIQSEAGVRGVKRVSQNISTRDVLGVENNGEDFGEVIFNVPQKNAQDYFINMEVVDTPHIATLAHFSDIQGYKLSKIPEGTFDGVYTNKDQLRGKTLIFINKDTDDIYWTPNGTYDLSNYNSELFSPRIDDFGNSQPERNYFDYSIVNGQRGVYDPGALVPQNLRFQVWVIDFYPGTDVMVLLPKNIVVDQDEKVQITTGIKYSNVYFYKTYEGFYERVPLITANLDTLFYQDGSASQFVGEFKLLDPNNLVIDIENEILNRKYYNSPNGVVFTNGLKVKFEGLIEPESYKNKEYYVEGVGEGIRLVEVNSLVTPEFSNTKEKDYLTINRSSVDLNPWSRYNRWFHSDVIAVTAQYNNTFPNYVQDNKARRPIIEFKPDLKLYDYGGFNTVEVDWVISSDAFELNNNQTNAFSDDIEVEGTPVNILAGQAVIYDNIVVKNGERILFPNDVDPVIRNKVYEIQFIRLDESGIDYIIHLQQLNDDVGENTNALAIQGPNLGITYWFNGSTWTKTRQPKTKVNQAPLFDIFDSDGISFTDSLTYYNSTFKGCKVFAYKENSAGVTDEFLGFPLSYKNFKNIGDIEFQNYFDLDEFSYLEVAPQYSTIKVNTGFLHKTITSVTYETKNIWNKCVEFTKQYQNFVYFADGVNNRFFVDVPIAIEESIPYLKVYVNNVLQEEVTNYIVLNDVSSHIIEILSGLKLNDKVDLLVYSNETSSIASYQVPVNLDFNAKNVNFTSLTLGQVREHVTTCISNSFIDKTLLRDYPVYEQGGTILQHAGPVSYAGLFLSESKFNYIKAIDLAKREYTRFKNNFLEACINLPGLDRGDPVNGVDTVLASLTAIKNKFFPWYYSDMIPYGNNKTIYTHTVLDEETKNYEISSIFNPNIPSSRAVLIYLNGVQLVHERDYVFEVNIPGILITDTVTLEIDDIIEIHDYVTTDGCYVPETPPKLGLAPKFNPDRYTDYTYQTPTEVIKGHDGSITPIFNDIRDNFLLELEKRIYNNIKTQYKDDLLSIYDVKPGKFRKTDYSTEEFNRMQQRFFLNWAGSNKLDYSKNIYYKNSSPFTWNYGLFNDIYEEKLSGSWKAIYRYYYDTETPHLTPWEMFGFSQKPNWWEQYYGPAPYTGENIVLWKDIEEGYIRDGARKGYDLRFARPGITAYTYTFNNQQKIITLIPVDGNGNLKEPAKIMAKAINSRLTSQSWEVGQVGPVEAAWLRSSDYVFAQQIILALAKPARYFGGLLDTYRNIRSKYSNQIVFSDTNQRLTPTDITFNGLERSGVVYRTTSYLNYIAEYLINLGINPSTILMNLLENYSINLSYQMGGFTDQQYLQILAEQSSPVSTNDSIAVPNENYSVDLLKSSPIKTLTYSAVIIEKTGTGYAIQGYDQNIPFFFYNAPIRKLRSSSIQILDESVAIYYEFESTEQIVSYGYEFKTVQDVVDFLLGYQNYLTKQGFVFEEVDTDLGEIKNFILSIKEFVFWSKQGWQDGNVLVLSPTSNRILITSNTAVVDKIEDSANGTRILDQNFNIIRSNDYSVYRDNYDFVAELNPDKIICLVQVNLVQYEHVLIFDNITVFNDVLYQPELGNRQVRLKVIGQKTADWDGRLSAPGFVYNADNILEWRPGTDYFKGDIIEFKTQYFTALDNIIASDKFVPSEWKLIDKNKIKFGLLSNFAFNATKSKNYYDADSSILDTATNRFGKSLIGFKERSYLSDLNLDQQTQIKFYQGFIKEKGTRNSITALINTQFNNITGNIELIEEWAFRVGEYGALETNQFAEVILDQAEIIANPTAIQFLSPDTTAETDVVGYTVDDIYRKTPRYDGNIALLRDRESLYTDDIPSAGYARLTDVNLTIFDLNEYYKLDEYLSSIGSGTTIWAAKDFSEHWNVFRVDETNNNVVYIENILNGLLKIETRYSHTVNKNDIIVIKGMDSRFDGFHKVYEIDGTRQFIVSYVGSTDGFSNVQGNGLFFKLRSVRFDNITELVDYVPLNGWKKQANVWVDNSSLGAWAVYQKSEPWEFDYDLQRPSGNISLGDKFGTSIAIFNDKQLLIVGSPGSNKIWTFGYNTTNKKYEIKINNDILGVYSPPANEVGFGSAMSAGTNYLAVSAPSSDTNRGNVVIYTKDVFGQLEYVQSLVGPASNNEFGYSLSLSRNDNWLYVGAPGCDGESGNVYAYRLQSNGSYVLYGNTGTITSNIAGDAEYFRFGSSIKTDSIGEYILIGAPQLNGSSANNTGKAFLYVRGIESFIGNTLAGNTYTAGDYLLSNAVVYVNEVEVEDVANSYTITGNTIAFFSNSAPGNGAVISVDTNKFDLIKEVSASDLQRLANFGSSVDLCSQSCVYVVGAPGYDGEDFNSGAAYVYIDQAREYGNITGSKANPTVTVGHSIKIDRQRITFTGTSLTSVVSDINFANINGITASIKTIDSNQYLQIDSDLLVRYKKLQITPGRNTAFDDLGLGNIIIQTQKISHPLPGPSEKFGQHIKLNRGAASVLISSIDGTGYQRTTFDMEKLTFDIDTTSFIDKNQDSGAVYQFERIDDVRRSIDYPSKYIYAQQLTVSNVGMDDQFGCSLEVSEVDLQQNMYDIYVGASNSYEYGNVYSFNNPTNKKAWDILHSKDEIVDPNSINSIYLYDNLTGIKLTNLDWIDPNKGKILGLAEQELDYKTSYDPAFYNNSANENIKANRDFYWAENQVGKTWWDLSRIRYVDYEQGDLKFRTSNWAKKFPDSEVVVYEWVESFVLPSQYTGGGIPKFPDNSAYSEVNAVDNNTGIIISKYYFWVRDRNFVSNNLKTRTIPITLISNIIENPQNQNIPYAAVLNRNSLALYNINDRLSADHILLHVDYDIVRNTNLIHSEFELVGEGINQLVPQRIVDKLIDSLSGLDQTGNNVPDYLLPESEKYGISIRPRQTMIINRALAVKQAFVYANNALSKYRILSRGDISGFYAQEPIPPLAENAYDLILPNIEELFYLNTALLVNDYKVLVRTDSTNDNLWVIYQYKSASDQWVAVRVQAYKAESYWVTVDWYADGFTSETEITKTVNSYNDLQKITLDSGDIIKVLDDGNGAFHIIEIISNYENTPSLTEQLWDQKVSNRNEFNEIPLVEPLPDLSENRHDIEVDDYPSLLSLDTAPLNDQVRVLVKSDVTRDDLWTIYQLNKDTGAWILKHVQIYLLSDGYKVLIESDSLYGNLWTIFQYNESIKTWDAIPVRIQKTYNPVINVVGVQNGTIKFLDPLYDLENYQPGFDIAAFDNIRFDQNSNLELRELLYTLLFDVFVDDLFDEFNGLFFTVINYILSEQKSLDWVFKSSFMSVLHKLRKLDQFPSFIKDNQDYYLDYINEVKPYRTKVREYLLDYEKLENFDGDVTDFDLPPYYDKDLELFRSPSGEDVLDSARHNQPEYSSWNQNKSLEVELVILENPGTSYTQTPDVTFINAGTGGTGASARAVVDFGTGRLTGIELLSPGFGYTKAPTILINGNGVGAKAYPQMINRKTRGIRTILKFDRVDYTHNILDWTANTFYSNGNVITYYDTITNTRNAYLFFGDESANSGPRFDSEMFVSVSQLKKWQANTAYQANSLVYYREPYFFANVFSHNIAFIAPNTIVTNGNTLLSASANLNFNNLQIKDGSTITVEYNGVVSTPNKGTYTVKEVTSNNIVVYEEFITNASEGELIALGTNRPGINTGNVYKVVTGFTSNSNFTTANLFELVPARNLLVDTIKSISNDWDPALKPNVANLNIVDYSITLAKANDRIMALYEPDQYSPIRDIKQLVKGIDYPGVIIDGVKFDVNIKSVSGNVIAFTQFGASNIGAITSSDDTVANLANLSLSNGDTIYVLDSDINDGYYTISNVVSSTNLVVSGNTVLGQAQITNEASGNTAIIYSWNGVDANLVLDANIASYFNSFGTLPNIADYTINGTSFIDVFNSHAPEELVPGSTFDHLNISVFTNASVTTGNVGYRVVKNMKDENQFVRISNNNTTTLAANLTIDDDVIYVTDASALPTVADLSGVYGVIYINGERIVYYDIDHISNTIRRFRRGTEGTGAADLHLVGSRVIDASEQQYLPVTGNTFFSYLYSNASITSNVISFYAANSAIVSSNTTLANLDILTPSTGNIVVINGSSFNSNVFYITSANASHIITANVVNNELEGNIVTMTFYSNVSPNLAFVSTEVTEFLTENPSF